MNERRNSRVAATGVALGKTRYLALLAVVGLGATTVATFVWSLAKSVKLIGDLLEGEWRDELKIVDLLKVVDSYLIAVVLLIVTLGLYELFVGGLEVPEWLHARSLDDLKKSIVDVLIVFIGVKGVEGLLSSKKALDTLYSTVAVAVLIGALTYFRSRGKGKGDS
jgi:uncharacterized membrane protein YqhA